MSAYSEDKSPLNGLKDDILLANEEDESSSIIVRSLNGMEYLPPIKSYMDVEVLKTNSLSDPSTNSSKESLEPSQFAKNENVSLPSLVSSIASSSASNTVHKEDRISVPLSILGQRRSPKSGLLFSNSSVKILGLSQHALNYNTSAQSSSKKLSFLETLESVPRETDILALKKLANTMNVNTAHVGEWETDEFDPATFALSYIFYKIPVDESIIDLLHSLRVNDLKEFYRSSNNYIRQQRAVWLSAISYQLILSIKRGDSVEKSKANILRCYEEALLSHESERVSRIAKTYERYFDIKSQEFPRKMFNTEHFPFQDDIEDFPKNISNYMCQILSDSQTEGPKKIIHKICKIFKS